MDHYPSDKGDGLLSDEEIQLLRRVARSKVWRLIADSLCLEREQLFNGNSSVSGLSGQPGTTEQLWMNRGAILVIQHLLQTGPQLVIWYRRHMDAMETEKDVRKLREGQEAPEREYVPEATEGLHERPSDFDL